MLDLNKQLPAYAMFGKKAGNSLCLITVLVFYQF